MLINVWKLNYQTEVVIWSSVFKMELRLTRRLYNFYAKNAPCTYTVTLINIQMPWYFVSYCFVYLPLTYTL